MLMDVLGEMARDALGPLAPALVDTGRAAATAFLSVLLGALPFVVVAALAAGIVDVFVSREALARLLPRHPLLAVLLAPLPGLLVPLCECAIVPVAARLLRKGAPLGAGIAFMLANPVVNPVPVYATATAFPFQPELVWLRVGAAYLYAVVIGLVVHLGVRGLPLRGELPAGPAPCCHVHGKGEAGSWTRWRHALDHAGREFFAVGRFFVLGAALASLVQVTLTRERLAAWGGDGLGGIVAMMALAYALNVCSEADAFVAAGFSGTFTVGALLAFLTLGPMTDVKNTLMMLTVFERGFVLLLHALVVGAVLIGSSLVDAWLYGG